MASQIFGIADWARKAPKEIFYEGCEGIYTVTEALSGALATNPIPWRAVWRPDPKKKPLFDKDGRNPVLEAHFLCEELVKKTPANRCALVESQLDTLQTFNAAF